MHLSMLKCPEYRLNFGVDKKAIGGDELVTCPKCDAEVDGEEDQPLVR